MCRKGDRFISLSQSQLKFQKKVIEKKEKRTSYFQMKPTWISGVDGFRREWFAILVHHAQGRVIETRHQICGSFKDVLNLTPAPKVIAIDIPIGLLDTPEIGGRECDREARRLLKPPRASSVFSPPIRKDFPGSPPAKKISSARRNRLAGDSVIRSFVLYCV